MITQQAFKLASCLSGRPIPFAASGRKANNYLFRLAFVVLLLAGSLVKTYAQTPGFSKTGGTTVNSNLLNSTNAFKTQFFYLPTDFSATPIAGTITRIYFRNTVANATGTYTNFKVFMGQTAATVFPGTGSLEFFTGLTQVKNSASLTLNGNATAGGWFFIDLDTPFAYDNTRTLIVEIQIGSFTGGISHFSTSSGVVPAHKKIFSNNTAAVSGTQDTNGWPNFGIDITPFPACSGAPTAGNAQSTLTTACVGAPFELSLTGTSLVSGLTYQWQSSPNGTTGWTDITGATSNKLTTSQTATTFYRANVSCGTNTSASGSVQVTTSSTPLTGTITVNKNNPATATNYQSFSALITDLICKGVSGPVTVNVTAGTGPYNEQLNFTPVPGASAINTITFNGNGNKISTSITTPSRAVITLNGADFIKFDNFQVEASDTNFGWGFHLFNGADNNTISNNTITIISANSLEAAAAGIFFTSSTTGASTGNTGNNNVINGNTIIGGHTGINLNSLTTATGNNQLTNNIIKDFLDAGIKIASAKGTLVEGNDISRPTRTVGSTLAGMRISGGSSATVISKNRIHNMQDATAGGTINDVSGIAFSSNDAQAGSENIVKNNLIYNFNNATGFVYALHNSGSDGVFYYHNTINLDNAATTGELRGFYQVTAASNVRFINNIISITAGTGTKTALFFETAASVITSNNNVLNVPNGNIGNFATAVKPTLTDWKATNGGIYDQNSVSANPNFVNIATGNLTPGNSTINNIGQPLAVVTDDFTGATRNATTPDPGAYEFVTPTTNDAGVTSIITPASPVAPGASNVEVIIKNFGSAALTSASITWSVNSVAQTPYAWTGNLAPGASAPVTIGTFIFAAGPFTLNVCTATPNGVTDENPSNDCLNLSGTSCVPLTGTFTIDKNSPASATNYQTIADAIQNLTSCGVSGPVTFNVVAGTGPYNEQVVLGTIPGTTAVNTVTFEGNANKISFAGVTANRPVIRLDGTDFVMINNFQVEASDATIGWGIHLTNGADNNTISNNTIIIASTSTTEANSVGIVFTNSTTQVNVPGNTGNNNLITGNTINGGFKGIHLNSLAAVNSQNRIVNNTIKDFYGYGIQLASAKGTLVEGNDISRPTRSNTVQNPSAGIVVADNSSATTISKNRIHNTHDAVTIKTGAFYAFYYLSADAPAGAENIAKNNLIYNINNSGAAYAFNNFNSDGAYYYHNTADLGNATSTGALRGFYQTGVATNVRFINNIITIGTSTGAKNGLLFESATSAITSNNNVIYVPGGNVGTFGTTAFATLANWKTANNNAYDQNSESSDPTYVNAATGNFQPSAGLINNIGQPLAAVTDDILGVTRNAATPDPGAYEFLAAQTDAGIIAITGPATTTCGLSNAETITVTIKNFGSQTLTTVPVTFSVNGTTIATETFTGSIAGNATANYTFTAKANLSVPGPYSIVAKTVLPGDGIPANDADTLSSANALFSTLPVNLDFETTNTGLARVKTIIQPQGTLVESAAASNGTGSTKGLIMAGISGFNWTLPVGITNPWTANPNNFAAVYFCVTPGASNPQDSLILSFDLKQLFKAVNANTNFRVTVNGTQVGPTYRPPFSGTPINWQKIRVDLSSYKSLPTIEIGLESNVKEEYDNGNGTANLVDNIKVERILVPTGIQENALQNQLRIYPNPSTGNFSVSLPTGKTYTLEVTDLAGKTMLKQEAKGDTQLNLETAAKGIYLLKITSDGQVAARKLVIQ